MARGKSASHRDISQAARRARDRPRGETLVAITLALSMLAVLVLVLASWHHGPNTAVATKGAASAQVGIDGARDTSPGDLTTVMENADRAWLNEVGSGKVVTANDGSDALSLPQSTPPSAAPIDATPQRARTAQDWPH